jgi:hypothetical protein
MVYGLQSPVSGLQSQVSASLMKLLAEVPSSFGAKKLI